MDWKFDIHFGNRLLPFVQRQCINVQLSKYDFRKAAIELPILVQFKIRKGFVIRYEVGYTHKRRY